MPILGQDSAFLASLTLYIEVEWHMMAKNDTHDKDNNLGARVHILGLSKLALNNHFWSELAKTGFLA